MRSRLWIHGLAHEVLRPPRACASSRIDCKIHFDHAAFPSESDSQSELDSRRSADSKA